MAVIVKLKLRHREVLLFLFLFGTIICRFSKSSSSGGYSNLISLTIIYEINSDSFKANALRHLSHITHHQRADTAHKMTLFLRYI